MKDDCSLSAWPLLRTTQRKLSTIRSQEAFFFWKMWERSLLSVSFEELALFINSSVYMSEEMTVEIQTWMFMQDVSSQLPIVCPVFLFPLWSRLIKDWT